MKKIGILSDTHSFWDDKYVQYFSDCDEIWHAGDIGNDDVADRLEGIAPLRAVCGNCDGGMLRRRFKEVAVFEIDGIKVLMTHIGGYPGKYAPGIKTLLQKEIKMVHLKIFLILLKGWMEKLSTKKQWKPYQKPVHLTIYTKTENKYTILAKF